MGALQGCMTKNQNLRKDSHGFEIASAHLHQSHSSVIENHISIPPENYDHGLILEDSKTRHNHSMIITPDIVDNNLETEKHSKEEFYNNESVHFTREHETDQRGSDVTLTYSELEEVEQQGDIDEMALNSSACQVAIQKPAPFFKGQAVVNGEFKEISLEDYKGKYLVLFFYPLDFTFVCPTEIIAFSDRADEFRQIGCELIAASTDSHFSHFAWVNTSRKNGGLGEMNIPLLADKTGAVAKKYGVYKEDEGIAYRGLFIIDGKQNVRQITINDLPVGRSVDETLRLVQAFQFTDKHGEVCPAGWKPGSKTIKPSVRESKAYFETS